MKSYDGLDFCLLMSATQNPYQSFIDMEDGEVKSSINIVKAYTNKGTLYKQMYIEFDTNFRSNAAKESF